MAETLTHAETAETIDAFNVTMNMLAGTIDHAPALDILDIFFQNKPLYDFLKEFTENFGQSDRAEFLSRFLGISVALCEQKIPAFGLAFVLNSIGSLYQTVMKKDINGQKHCYSFVRQDLFSKNEERTEYFVSVILSTFEQISVHLVIDPDDPQFGFIGVTNPRADEQADKLRVSYLPSSFCIDIYNEYIRPLMDYRKEVTEHISDIVEEQKATLIFDDAKEEQSGDAK